MRRLFLLLLAVGALAAAGTARAAVYYVDTIGVESDSLIAKVAQAKANPETDTIYIAIGTYKMDKELIVEDIIIGGCTFGSNNSITRQYPGAVGNDRNRMTILDGNSFVLSLPSLKHRVATINAGGVIDGCLIRNGHARGTTNNPNDTKGFGGGVLINTGGKLHNSIVRGNVAMNLQFSKTNPSYGGGVYVNGGDVANCIIAFNMDDMGLGVGGSSGTILNNTIARNANAPRFVLIPGTNGTPYRHYLHNNYLTTNLVLPYIELDSFYMAATETTMGQYACFFAAIDVNKVSNGIGAVVDWIAMCAAMTPMYGYNKIAISKYLGMDDNDGIPYPDNPTPAAVELIRTYINHTNTQYLGVSDIVGSGSAVYYPLKATSPAYAAGTSGGVDYPADPLVRDNFPMGFVNWYGSLAFCVWIGGMLPTEAQWEYAARKKADGSVQNEAVYVGGYTDVNKVGWHDGNSGTPNSSPHEVATLLPSWLGLYDMCGNQREWLADGYNHAGWNYGTLPTGISVGPAGPAADNAYTSTVAGVSGNSPTTSVHNPIYNYSGSRRMCGGSTGSWNSYGDFTLGYHVSTDGPMATYGYIGFRSAACAGL